MLNIWDLWEHTGSTVWHWKCLWECWSDSLSCHAAIPPSIHPSILLQSWQQKTEGNLPPGRPAVERWVRVLIDSRSVGGKEEFALSCQTPRWIEAFMTMLRIEYTCSFLLGGRGKENRKMLLLLLCLLYKLLRLEAGLKASGFVACHYFSGLVWFGARVCLWVVFSSSHPALQISNQPAAQHCF